MKIAILGTRGIPARYGGFETFAEELALRLVERGIDVTVYCEGEEGSGPAEYHGVKLVYLPSPPLGPLSTILFDLRCLWHARMGFDVVYMLGYGAAIFCFLPRLWGSEVWLNVDGVEWARSKWSLPAKVWFKMMEWAAMRTPDRVIADADAIYRHLRSRHTRLPAVSVIPYGAPVVEEPPLRQLPATLGLSPGKYYLVVCRLEPENSVLEIIEGYLAAGSKYPLIVVGGLQPSTRYIRRLLQFACPSVRFIGAVYDKEALQALRWHAFAYFHGHTVGGTNPSLLEALGCGNVVIASDNRFNREVAGKAATYFADEKDVATVIGEMEFRSATGLQALKEMAVRRVRLRYSWDRVLHAYLGLLDPREVAAEHPLPEPSMPDDVWNIVRLHRPLIGTPASIPEAANAERMQIRKESRL